MGGERQRALRLGKAASLVPGALGAVERAPRPGRTAGCVPEPDRAAECALWPDGEQLARMRGWMQSLAGRSDWPPSPAGAPCHSMTPALVAVSSALLPCFQLTPFGAALRIHPVFPTR